MSRILITGASGFIGRHCLDLLCQEHEVHALTQSARATDEKNLFWYRANVLDPETTTRLVREIKPTHLLHLAWVTSPKVYRDSPQNLEWLAASAQLLQSFVAAGGRRVVMIGSCAEYDWQQGNCDEDTTPLHPSNLYGTCKNALRQVLESYTRQMGVSAAWARLFFLFGPGEHPDRFVASMIRSMIQGQIAVCGNGRLRRDYIFVKDAARAISQLLLGEVEGALNIGTGTAVELVYLARKLAGILNSEQHLRFGQNPSAERPLVVAGQKRLRGELGWLPSYTLDQALAESVAWWQNQLRCELTPISF